MLNINLNLKDRNPVLREASFDYIIKQNIVDIELYVMNYIQIHPLIIFSTSLEESIYAYIDKKESNILHTLLIRHGIHYTAEAIVFKIMESTTELSEQIKTNCLNITINNEN